jgi:nitrate reductase gamma subunit
MEYILRFLTIYACIAGTLFVGGVIYKFLRYLWLKLTLGGRLVKRTQTPHSLERMSYLKALWRVNVTTFTKFWAKANFPTFAAHTLYHIAIGTAIISYILSNLVLLVSGRLVSISTDGFWVMPISNILRYTFDWFHYIEYIYGEVGLTGVGNILFLFFKIAVVFGIFAELTTLILSKLHKRGMIRPIDEPTKIAKIYTNGLPRASMGGYERKLIGLMVLCIVGSIFLDLMGILDHKIAFIIHAAIALTFIAIFPYTMLFHELSRWRMWTAVVRMVDRRTA